MREGPVRGGAEGALTEGAEGTVRDGEERKLGESGATFAAEMGMGVEARMKNDKKEIKDMVRKMLDHSEEEAKKSREAIMKMKQGINIWKCNSILNE